MTKPYAIVFAGVPGSSKTIVAHYLSAKFHLPIFSSDVLRYEVKEDMYLENLSIKDDLMFDNINNIPGAIDEFEKRMTKRRLELLATGQPVIFDGSVDRRWAETKKQLQDNDYTWFMIDMELSRSFLEELFAKTGRQHFLPQLDSYFRHHREFLDKYAHDISLKITDQIFKDRNQVAAEALEKYIDSL